MSDAELAPEASLHHAAEAIPRTIEKEAINHLPLCRYDGPVVVVSSLPQLVEVLPSLQRETLLGFDTETRPTFRKGENHPTALLQLAGSEGVWLFQLQLLQGGLPALFNVLADPEILKVGVATHDDVRKLRELRDFKPAGFVELSTLSARAGVVNTGLRALTAIFLGARLSKGAQVTNWARRQLTDAQIQYAATDAWVSRELYMRLRELGLANGVSP